MRLCLATIALCVAAPALANDSMAELRTGGLAYVRSDVVIMKSEDLFISEAEVKVNYVFQNSSDQDVESVVAFPMPRIVANPFSDVAVPEPGVDNFLGFEVMVDGAPLQPQLEQKAYAAELDISAELSAHGVPLNPLKDGVDEAIDKLPAATLADWIARGIVVVEEYDDGKGMQKHHSPTWAFSSTYWWRMNFPAGKPVRVSHRYKPSVGGTVGVSFMEDGKASGERFEEYAKRYCVDATLARAMEKAAAKHPDGYPPYTESWISYVLTTGANWAGNIEKFHLTIDKGAPENLVSFCGEGVTKTGPTRFELSAQDFYPEKDLDILILKPFATEEPSAKDGNVEKPAARDGAKP